MKVISSVKFINFLKLVSFEKNLHNNTQASKALKSMPDRKISKDRVSALLCANADGSHLRLL